MRIGILTFHCSYNFGAVLQCYALQEFLTTLGHDVSIINYRPDYLVSKMPEIDFKYILRHPRKAYSYIHEWYPIKKQRYNKFQDFENKYYKLSSYLHSKDEIERFINKNLDFVVFGSDQIWCERFNAKDAIWYGDLNKKLSIKFISYAASAGDAVFSEEGLRLMQQVVPQMFTAISVRERKLLQFVEKNASLVMDPTLMVPESIYQKWYAPILRERYVLVRQARPDTVIYKIARGIANQIGAQIVTADTHQASFDNSDRVMPCSPSEFVSLVKNAECVISNSFHGVALALITKVPFYAIRLYDGGDERILNLLEMLNLLNRVVDKQSTPVFDKINYKDVDSALDELRKSSQEFLIKNTVCTY